MTPTPTPDPEPSSTTDPTPEPEQIPTAPADKWHPGWCNKDENGYSVLIDMAALDPKDRGDLNPATTTYTDAHVKDGWLVRCHKGLEPIKTVEHDSPDRWAMPEYWAANVGIPGMVNTRRGAEWEYRFLGITPWYGMTSNDERISTGVFAVEPVKNGVLPPVSYTHLTLPTTPYV